METSETLRGAHTIKRQIAGHGNYAHVGVELRPGEGVVVRDREKIAGQVDYVEGAVRGCSNAARELSLSYRITITELRWMVVDTTPDAMSAAAFMAVAKACGRGADFEAVKLDRGDEWTVRPTSSDP